MSGCDIEFLGFMAGLRDGRSSLIERLMHLDSPPWGELDEPAFSSSFSEIKAQLDCEPQLLRLFELHLLAWLLKDRARAPSWASCFLKHQIGLHDHFPGIGLDTLMEGRWTGVPVLMVANGIAAIHDFMVGRIRGQNHKNLWPAWADPLMDESCRNAVRSAARAAAAIHSPERGTVLQVFPMAMADGLCRYSGTSLGLPVAIGFLKVLTGEKASEKVLATGAVDENGRVGKVDGVKEKQGRAAIEEMFSLFLYPDDNDPTIDPGSMDVLPVSRLEEAWLFSTLHVPGNGRRMLELSRMLDGAPEFLSRMSTVDSQWVKYLADRGKFSGTLRDITGSAGYFAGYVSGQKMALESRRLDDALVYRDLISAQLFDRAAAVAPLSAFDFAGATLALANHSGDVAAGREASERAGKLFDQALKGDVNRCADFLNHRFVSLHNEYRFEQEFPAGLERLLEMLESRHRCQCEFGCPTDRVLASLYGTIAQNFGFCGPGHLENTVKYARMAVDAFGGGEVPEYRGDALRQYGYLVYAGLDAGGHDDARGNLFRFLDVPGWEQVAGLREQNRLSVWHHTALARFLADTADRQHGPDYLESCSRGRAVFANTDHPRQLWTYNLGRIALNLGCRDPAIAWFRQSLDLCLKTETRPTIYVMSLLPASALWGLGALDTDGDRQCVTQAVGVALELNRSHFEPLSGSDSETALKQVRENPQRFFPFSYR
jgi:hypothetical protein